MILVLGTVNVVAISFLLYIVLWVYPDPRIWCYHCRHPQENHITNLAGHHGCQLCDKRCPTMKEGAHAR